MRFALALAWLLGVAASAAHAAVNTEASSANGASKYFAGVSLVDQDGRGLDLYRDVIDGHTVVMHSFFASCTASCPVTMATLQAVQGRLGARLGSEVRMVSITVDPERDKPAVLKEYSARVGAKAGWSFLTGSGDQVGNALKRIGQYVGEPDAHMDIIVVGNTRTGLWKKIRGTATSAEVVALIVGVADDGAPLAPQTRKAPVADSAVTTQDNRPVRFYRDLVQGRVVAVNFIFTDCTAVCSVMGARFARLQALLEEAGIEASLVSISIDPATDTPARLAEWSRNLGARPGWTLVTGERTEIDALVKSLGSSAADPGSHTPLVVVIDDLHGGAMQRLDGLADPAAMARVLKERVQRAQVR